MDASKALAAQGDVTASQSADASSSETTSNGTKRATTLADGAPPPRKQRRDAASMIGPAKQAPGAIASSAVLTG